LPFRCVPVALCEFSQLDVTQDSLVSLANAAKLLGKLFGLVNADQTRIGPAQIRGQNVLGYSQEHVRVVRPKADFLRQLRSAHGRSGRPVMGSNGVLARPGKPGRGRPGTYQPGVSGMPLILPLPRPKPGLTFRLSASACCCRHAHTRRAKSLAGSPRLRT